jgi:glycosyltransferase involved in cell wall biosynthesis
VPLVCAAAEGVAELVGGAAMLVPPGDAEALDGAVRWLLADPDRRAARARAGLARAANWPSEAEAARRVLAVYAALGARDAPRDLR